jgi:hypothetical protein
MPGTVLPGAIRKALRVSWVPLESAMAGTVLRNGPAHEMGKPPRTNEAAKLRILLPFTTHTHRLPGG